jgi:branched-chain amino acid transport system substrate-binding protein
VIPNLISDDSIIGVLGPAFSGESKAVDGLFDQAGLVSVTASATNPGLAQHGWKTFFRGLANDAVQGPAVASYIKKQLAAKKVYVVKDDSDYGKGLAAELQKGLGDLVTGTGDVKTGAKEFSAIVNDIKTAAPDLVFYSGYYAEASPFVQQLREGGYTGTFMSGDGTNDPQFINGAGSAAKDAYLSCPCGPSPEEFAKDYTDVNNGAKPGTYSVEGFDLTTILLAGIDAGNTTRSKLLSFVGSYDGQGLARHYKWDSKGELSEKLIWIDQVK